MLEILAIIYVIIGITFTEALVKIAKIRDNTTHNYVMARIFLILFYPIVILVLCLKILDDDFV